MAWELVITAGYIRQYSKSNPATRPCNSWTNYGTERSVEYSSYKHHNSMVNCSISQTEYFHHPKSFCHFPCYAPLKMHVARILVSMQFKVECQRVSHLHVHVQAATKWSKGSSFKASPELLHKTGSLINTRNTDCPVPVLATMVNTSRG